MSSIVSQLNLNQCPLCSEGQVTELTRSRRFEHRHKVGIVALHFSSCNFCNAETVNDEQSILNRRELNRFKKQVDQVPLGSAIRAMRKLAELTQAQAGELFGGGPVAFSKYENDDLIPDEAMSNLLRLAIRNPEIIEQLREAKQHTFISQTVGTFSSAVAHPSSAWVGDAFSDEAHEADTTAEILMNKNYRKDAKQSWSTLH